MLNSEDTMRALWEISREAQKSPDILPHSKIMKRVLCNKLNVKTEEEAVSKAVPAIHKYLEQVGYIVQWRLLRVSLTEVEAEALVVVLDNG